MGPALNFLSSELNLESRFGSTSRRIGCEPGNPWPAERDFQDILVQPCPRSSAGCSEGSGSESRSQPDYFPVTSDHYESEAGDKIREGDEHYEVEQGDEGTQTTEDEHDTVRRLKEAAAEEGYSGLGGPIGGDIHRYRVNRPTRSPSHPLPSKSTDRVRIESALRSPSVEEKERRYVDSTEPRETVRVELGPPRRARFGAVQSNPNNRVGVTENGQQLAERESGFHEYVVEGLDAVGSIRNSNTGGVQRHRSGSSSWSEDLEEVPDRLSLQVDEMVDDSSQTTLFCRYSSPSHPSLELEGRKKVIERNRTQDFIYFHFSAHQRLMNLVRFGIGKIWKWLRITGLQYFTNATAKRGLAGEE